MDDPETAAREIGPRGLQKSYTLGYLLVRVQESGLDAPVLSERDPRWGRLKFQPGPAVGLRDRFRGALACAVAGAYHGFSRLPRRLLRGLEYRETLLKLADGLYELRMKLYGPD